MRAVWSLFMAAGMFLAGLSIGIRNAPARMATDNSWQELAVKAVAATGACTSTFQKYLCADPRTGPLDAANIGCKDWHSTDPVLRAPAEVSHAI